MGIAFLDADVCEIRQYLAVHQIYLGRSDTRGRRNLWSFTAIDGGQLFEIDGPIVMFEDRKTASGKTARRMVVNQPHFQVCGGKRWYRPEDMARFAFQGAYGFRWRDIPDVAPTDPLAHLAAGYGHGDDRLRSLPYARPHAADEAAAVLLSLGEGYGAAQCGHGFVTRARQKRSTRGGG